jgi:hypothetical protein
VGVLEEDVSIAQSVSGTYVCKVLLLIESTVKRAAPKVYKKNLLFHSHEVLVKKLQLCSRK